MPFRPAGYDVERMPLRSRQALPADGLGRRELAAAAGLLLVALQLLFGQLTLLIAIVLIGVGRLTRWRSDWLAVPAACGLLWALAIGLPAAFRGLVAGPRQVAGQLAAAFSGHLDRLAHLGTVFAGAGNWLPRQLPLALIAAAAEAAVAGLAWQRQLPVRPGLIRLTRRWTGSRALAAGPVVTRDGCGLGIDLADDRLAELSWREARGGVLLTGPDARHLRRLGCAISAAAIGRRKTVLVIDGTADHELAAAMTAACAAAAAELQRPAAGLGRPAIGRAIRARSVVLSAPVTGKPGEATAAAGQPAGSPQAAVTDLAAVLAGLADLRLRADCLVWLHACESVQAGPLSNLIALGRGTGATVLLSTADPAAAAALAGSAEVVVLAGPADPALATDLVRLTGRSGLPGRSRLPGQPGPGRSWLTRRARLALPGLAEVASGAALADALIGQAQAEFTLIARGTRPRLQAGWLPESGRGQSW